MTKSILSDTQNKFLVYFGKSKLANSFYLSGGTALAEFYIPYRYSEDLDFFSENEFEVSQVLVYLKSTKKSLGYKKIDFNTSFNRNIFHLLFPKETLKLEFTYYPFPQIEKPIIRKDFMVDSSIDIATNKIFTIYQNPRSRDFIDLYMLHKKFGYSMKDLIGKAKAKFDWHVDPIKLGSQFQLVKKVKDYPRLITKVKNQDWQNFFLEEANKLQINIFKK